MTAWIAVGIAVVGIYIVGPRLAVTAERLADRLNIARAIGGAVFLGLTTSLSGTVVSVSAAARGDAELALSNGLGGIAAQTVFLAVADFFHPKANLEHDAASVTNLFQIGLLLVLLSAVIMAFVGPDVTLWHLHPVSLLLPVAWAIGTWIASRTGRAEPWSARGPTPRPPAAGDPAEGHSWAGLIVRFVGYAAVVAACGYALSVYAPDLTEQLGVSTSAIGFVLTATATSLPELVTTISSVRRGALAFAVGNIVGGNAFDTLFCAIADFAYTKGSIYHAAGRVEPFITALGLLLTGLLLLGLIGREKRGVLRVGTEGWLIIGVYGLGAAAVVALPG